MTISDGVGAAIESQIALERSLAHAYRGWADRFADEGLPGLAAWMKMRRAEIDNHANSLRQFLRDRGYSPQPPAVESLSSLYFDRPVDGLSLAL